MASESKGGFEPAKAGGSTVVIEELTSDSLAQEPSETEKHATETEFQSVAFAPWIVTDPASKEKLRQWNLEPTLSLSKYSFAGAFTDDEKYVSQFLIDLFNSPVLRASMPVASKQGQTTLSGTVESVQYDALPTSVTSMTFFDRLVDEGIVTETGYIRKCIDDVIEGCTVSDLFRELLVNPDSENACLFDDDERDEFIFQLMRAVATGGSMCQYEDKWTPYLDAVKRTYKDMLKVYKNANTGKIQVASHVFRVTGLTGAGLFPVENDHNACFVAVDPTARTVTVWYSAFVPFW